MGDTIRSTREGDLAVIVLNRPDRLNAFDEEMHLALRAALDGVGDARAVLLTGAGRGFCAGQDLGRRNPDGEDWPPDLSATLREFYNPLIRQIRALPVPVVCAVNGVAAGAGVSVALACDIVLAAESAKFVMSFARVGLLPDAGATWTLSRLVGEARAKAMALTGEPVDAVRAADWGMIWKAVPDGALMAEATGLALELSRGATMGLGLTKRAMRAAEGNTLEAQMDLEAELQGIAGATADYAEGVRAFLGKRAPVFRGPAS